MKTATKVRESAAPYGVIAERVVRVGERRVLLHGISWATYKALLSDLGNSRACRLAFDSGELEIMSPYYKHENSQLGLGQMVLILAEETGLQCQPAGALTCEREDLQKAIEPDGCFYIQHFDEVTEVEDIDLRIHPPPDLMLEIDISTNSMNKLGICATLGVPEHWRFDGEKLEIRILKNGGYQLVLESPTFPGMPLSQILPGYIRASRKDYIATMRQFRAWVRGELRKRSSTRGVRKQKK